MRRSYTYTLTAFLLFLLMPCFGCAQQDTHTGVSAAATEKQDELADELDILLMDDSFDSVGSSVSGRGYNDPLEPLNRVFFQFNDTLYYWVLHPLNNAYSTVLPWDLRYAIGNFVSNLAAPVRLLNNVLQWKLADAGVVVSRFLINSTLGVYGFGDPARIEFGLEPKLEDFGQTLGAWGVGEGIYLCLPVLGPSSVRDAVGIATDAYTHPMVYFVDDFWISGEYYVLGRVNVLSLNPTVYEDLKKYSLDPYVSMRQVYLDHRRTVINDKM